MRRLLEWKTNRPSPVMSVVSPSLKLKCEITIMGAWAEDTFGNDSACDWIGPFLDNPGLDTVKDAIDTVLDTEDYLDSDEACDCLAACEVIARLQGKFGLRNAYSEDLDKWVAENPIEVPDDIKNAADSAIGRILGPDSELPQLCHNSGMTAGETTNGTMQSMICECGSRANNCVNVRSGRGPCTIRHGLRVDEQRVATEHSKNTLGRQ